MARKLRDEFADFHMHAVLTDLLPGTLFNGLRRMGNRLYADYTVKEMEVIFGWEEGSWEPDSLHVESSRKRGISMRTMPDLPFDHAKSVMTAYIEEKALNAAREIIGDLPMYVQTAEEWYIVARAYVELVKAGSRSPVMRMVDWNGQGKPTWQARMSKARKHGFLIGGVGGHGGHAVTKGIRAVRVPGFQEPTKKVRPKAHPPMTKPWL